MQDWNGTERLAQTFAPEKDLVVRKLALFAGNGNGSTAQEPLEVSVVARADGRTLARVPLSDYAPDFRQPLEIVLPSPVALKAGAEYAIELKAKRKTAPIVWFVSRDDVFPRGQALRDGKPIADKNGKTSDFGFALYR